jgi:hypothetical protein
MKSAWLALCSFTNICCVVIVCKCTGAVCKLLCLHRNVVKDFVLLRCDALALGILRGSKVCEE